MKITSLQKIMRHTSYLHGAPIVIFTIAGIILIVGIALSLGGFDWLIKTGILTLLRINNGTDLYNNWKDIPIPLYFRGTIFNITNPEEFANGAKAKLVETGPYVYRQKIFKVDITFNEENDTVRYRQIRNYFFVPEMSNGLESDRVTFVNIPFVAFAKIAYDFTQVDFLLNQLDEFLYARGEKFTRTQTVKELLFDGFSIQPYIDLLNDPLVQSAGEVKIPPQLQDGRMGLFKGRNGSDEGWFEVYRGNFNYIDFGRIATYNGNTSVTVWKGNPCNQINGTDGMLYQTYVDPKNTVLQAFVPTVCRTITFDPDPDWVYNNGVKTRRYRQSLKMYQSLKNNPDNWCFCTINGTCDTNGLIDAGPCLGGAPIYISHPHFLYVDEEFRNKVDGLHPDPDKHSGYMDLHPILSMAIVAQHKFQFNLKISQYDDMPTFENVTNHYVPVMWMEEGAALDGMNLLIFKVSNMFIVNGSIFFSLFLGMIGGILLPSIASFIIMKRRKKNVVVILVN